MIELIDIKKTYFSQGAPSEVLRGISVSIPKAVLAAVVGPSGSGKSTLLHVVAGLEMPDSGAVVVDNQTISSRGAESMAQFRLEHVGLVFQFFNFLPTLSLLENVALPAYLKGSARTAARAKALGLLERVGVKQLSNKLPHEVSGGELQRAAIARAMVNDPKILLADEPTGNLDRQNGEAVLEIFRQLVIDQGVTALIVTHDQRIEDISDQVIRLADGAIQEIVSGVDSRAASNQVENNQAAPLNPPSVTLGIAGVTPE